MRDKHGGRSRGAQPGPLEKCWGSWTDKSKANPDMDVLPDGGHEEAPESVPRTWTNPERSGGENTGRGQNWAKGRSGWRLQRVLSRVPGGCPGKLGSRGDE